MQFILCKDIQIEWKSIKLACIFSRDADYLMQR